MMTKSAKTTSRKTPKISFEAQNSVQVRAAAECGLPIGRFRQAAAACQKRNHFTDEGDLISELWLQMNKFKDVAATVLIANVVTKTRQTGSQSILCAVSLNSSLDDDGDDRTIDLVAPDLEEIAISRQFEVLGVDVDGLRGRIMRQLGVTDRRARQIIAEETKKIECRNQSDMFGFDFGGAE